MSVERRTRWTGVDRLVARTLVALLAANVAGTGLAHARETEPAGAISVVSEPVGATVYVDGQAQGTTPVAVKAAPGDHRVRVEKNGYLENSRVVSVPSGSSRSVQVKLTPDGRTSKPLMQVETEKPANGGGGGGKKALLIGLGVVAVGVGVAVAVSGGNKPPTVGSVTANPTTALQGTSVSFTAQASDPDNDSLTYSWNFGDGGNGSGASTTHAYATSGAFNASVSVSDGKKSATGNTNVTVKSMTGTWAGTFTIPGVGTLTSQMVMSQNAATINGTYIDQADLAGAISGTVSGTNSVRITVSVPGFAPFVYSGTVDASVDRYTGSITGSGLDGSSFSLTRR